MASDDLDYGNDQVSGVVGDDGQSSDRIIATAGASSTAVYAPSATQTSNPFDGSGNGGNTGNDTDSGTNVTNQSVDETTGEID